MANLIPKGAVAFRCVRLWHAGVPNTSNDVRHSASSNGHGCAAAPLTPDSPLLLAVLALVYNSAQVYDPRSSRMLHDETRSSPRRAEDAGANGRLRFARSCEPAFARRPGQAESLVDHNVDFVDGEC